LQIKDNLAEFTPHVHWETPYGITRFRVKDGKFHLASVSDMGHACRGCQCVLKVRVSSETKSFWHPLSEGGNIVPAGFGIVRIAIWAESAIYTYGGTEAAINLRAGENILSGAQAPKSRFLCKAIDNCTNPPYLPGHQRRVSVSFSKQTGLRQCFARASEHADRGIKLIPTYAAGNTVS